MRKISRLIVVVLTFPTPQKKKPTNAFVCKTTRRTNPPYSKSSSMSLGISRWRGKSRWLGGLLSWEGGYQALSQFSNYEPFTPSKGKNCPDNRVYVNSGPLQFKPCQSLVIHMELLSSLLNRPPIVFSATRGFQRITIRWGCSSEVSWWDMADQDWRPPSSLFREILGVRQYN